MTRWVAFLLLLATPALGQETVITSPIDGATVVLDDIEEEDTRALLGSGVSLKGLDKVSGAVSDIDLAKGETTVIGRLEVTLAECRYPEDNPSGEGFAWLTIRDPNRDAVIFDGWMVASSPALNALDHPRYDVWIIRCTTA